MDNSCSYTTLGHLELDQLSRLILVINLGKYFSCQVDDHHRGRLK